MKGVTLIEMMLVLAIAASLIAVGIRQYQLYKFSADVMQVKANVDKIFQAASYFYQTQCQAKSSNKLAPTVTTNPVAINIATDLIMTGYLQGSIPANPLVASTSGDPYSGYRVQYVRSESPRYICTSTDCATKTQIGTIVNWQIQVSAKLQDTARATQIKDTAVATCLTSANSADGVTSCASAQSFAQTCQQASAALAANPNDTGASQTYKNNGCGSSNGTYDNYLSFMNSPSFSAPLEGQSGLGMSEKRLQQFKQMYDTANINYLTGVGHNPEYQYFNCGS